MRGDMGELSIRAPAKINLHLQVIGKRPDGFHELRTLFQAVDLYDELRARPAAGEVELEVEPRGAAPAGDDNLVLRAGQALKRRFGVRDGARLNLVKRIPAGGGLGGGSSDAAAALRLLARLWALDLEPADLFELAASLGDVPYFMVGGLALGCGRGEEALPLPDLPPLGVIIGFPDECVPTAEVYGRLGRNLTWQSPDATVYCFSAGLTTVLEWQRLHNDLQPVVLEDWPAVAEVLEQLEALRPMRAAVTGSGAAVYALFESPREAQRAARRLEGGWQRHVGAVLPRSHSLCAVREVAVEDGARASSCSDHG